MSTMPLYQVQLTSPDGKTFNYVFLQIHFMGYPNKYIETTTLHALCRVRRNDKTGL